MKFNSTEEMLTKALVALQDTEHILLAYESGFHYVMFDINLEQASINVFDSKRRNEKYIEPFIKLLNK